MIALRLLPVLVTAIALVMPVTAAHALVPGVTSGAVTSGAVTSTPQRLAGGDRYSTSVAIASRFAEGVPVAYVATGTNYPDALSAAPAAAALGGPLLLTAPDSLPAVVAAEITRLAPQLIVVVGGNAAVSPEVYDQLSAMTPAIRRDSGVDRYETSRTINRNAFPAGSPSAFVATGTNFPDALSASAAAGSVSAPVVLVDGSASAVAPATSELLTSLHVTSVKIAGGTAVVSESLSASLRTVTGVGVVSRLAGADRYSTSVAINNGSFESAPTVFLAVGSGFADALAGAALAGHDHAPLFVTPGNCVYASTLAEMARLGATTHVLLGGPAALTSGVENLITCESLSQPVPDVQPTVPPRPSSGINCSSFSTQPEAQAFYNLYYPAYGDIARLDRDNDGIACESLPR
ncbi:cell wall-binding repeat-containing protein [Lacisediminihabitans changchengi]|uniref:Cell wall-binding repeat-containing protein n=1 Tax=Lacisediminihabitans changchengi TaxID=2787634 RepID=A0A934SIZ3_9MICO|nr:cell wall-binding repeat-containing protein [Lacisediminihabitans changchengi]MBK4346468.1 cell wall-binding repeat-containing protein [Lacisediminihabitans changchengi]MBK4348904.1 cell wall-binding repeat-containing protein [Lacisediminihabitans changchengi]